MFSKKKPHKAEPRDVTLEERVCRLEAFINKHVGKLPPIGEEHTSPEAASAAGRVLNDPNASEDAKSAAGSALTQKQ